MTERIAVPAVITSSTIITLHRDAAGNVETLPPNKPNCKAIAIQIELQQGQQTLRIRNIYLLLLFLFLSVIDDAFIFAEELVPCSANGRTQGNAFVCCAKERVELNSGGMNSPCKHSASPTHVSCSQ
jgi:hypothetical protein